MLPCRSVVERIVMCALAGPSATPGIAHSSKSTDPVMKLQLTLFMMITHSDRASLCLFQGGSNLAAQDSICLPRHPQNPRAGRMPALPGTVLPGNVLRVNLKTLRLDVNGIRPFKYYYDIAYGGTYR